MKNNSYSFNKRLEIISRAYFFIIIVSAMFGILLCLEFYDQSVKGWIIENISNNTGISNSITPIQQTIGPIPYGKILQNNLISIMIIPMIFITFSLFILRKAHKIFIKNEIVKLYTSIGISPSENLVGTTNIGLNDKLIINGSIEGLFQLKRNDMTLTTISGDELYWKIKYLKFLNEK